MTEFSLWKYFNNCIIFTAFKKFLKRLLPARVYQRLSLRLNSSGLTLGKGAWLHPTVQTLGRSKIQIGINSCVSERCWLNVNHRSEAGMSILIGNNTFIGRDNFFSSGRMIQIGDYCLTTLGCKFICSTHIADMPWLPIATTGTTSTDVIKVGDNCFFGAGATVLGNVTIGHGSVIGANALVTSDIPPFSMVIGTPAKVVKRYSFKNREWVSLTLLTHEDLDENPDSEAYGKQLRDGYPLVDIPWIASGADQGSF